MKGVNINIDLNMEFVTMNNVGMMIKAGAHAKN